MRSGWDEASRNAAEVAAAAEAAGLAMVTVHGRTRVQLYHGEADWSVIPAIRSRVSIPVVGSGDVMTADDALCREREFAPDGVMIGRGALANPWIFRQIEELRHGAVAHRPSLEERARRDANLRSLPRRGLMLRSRSLPACASLPVV